MKCPVGQIDGGPYLSPGYPNPFNPRTSLELAADLDQNARVDVYDVTGRNVSTLFDGWLAQASVTSAEFDGADLPSRIYFVRAVGSTLLSSRAITMLK